MAWKLHIVPNKEDPTIYRDKDKESLNVDHSNINSYTLSVGGAVEPVTYPSIDSLQSALRDVGVPSASIDSMVGVFESGKSHTLREDLTDEDLTKLGFLIRQTR